MYRTIQRLQEKPPHVRTRAALGVSAGVTILVFAVWITTLDLTRAPQTAGMIVYEQDDERSSQVASPFSALQDDASDAWGSFRTMFGIDREEEEGGGFIVVDKESASEEVESDIEYSPSE